MTDQLKTYELAVCAWSGNPRYCVYLNDFRIVGPKPWGGTSDMQIWHFTADDLRRALPDLVITERTPSHPQSDRGS